MQKHHRPLSILTSTSGQEQDVELKFDTNVKKIYGLQLDSDHLDRLYFRTGLRLEINGVEVLPANYPSKALTSSQGVTTNERFNKWIFGENGIPAGNLEIKVKLKDTNHPNATFIPYKTNLLFLVQI